MIKASGQMDGGPMLVIGLSRENCTRLLEGKPILFNTEEAGPNLPPMAVLIAGGETEAAIAAELHAHFPPREQ